MRLIRNKLTPNQIRLLPERLSQFLVSAKLTYPKTKFLVNTIRNIRHGAEGRAIHDTWISGENIDCYCLCRAEIDSDGEKVYTAYQMYMHKYPRELTDVKKVIKFLRFYAQKQGYKRLYVISSRLDKIKAYSRGLGKQFKVKTVTFENEF